MSEIHKTMEGRTLPPSSIRETMPNTPTSLTGRAHPPIYHRRPFLSSAPLVIFFRDLCGGIGAKIDAYLQNPLAVSHLFHALVATV